MKRLLALVLRIFFRRTAVTGAEHVAQSGPLLLVVNHPNSLVDPVFVLAFSPRRARFLAKAPLFRIPVVGWLTRTTGSIPVHRAQDGADMNQNRRMFETVWHELARGEAIALFPEGVSHDDPKTRHFKGGAARIALGHVERTGSPISIVPAGIYYTEKTRFRSSALLAFGTPIIVTPTAGPGPDSREQARALTATLETALAAVTIQADEAAALRLAARAERIVSSTHGSAVADRNLAEQFALRRRLVDGYARFAERSPQRLARATRLVVQYDSALDAAGLSPENVLASRLTIGTVARNAIRAIATLAVLLPFAIVGFIVHLIPYLAIRPFVTRVLRTRHDVLATTKILSAAAVFPLVWTVVAVAVARGSGVFIGVVSWLAMPLTGYAALRFTEQFDRLIGAARGLSLRLLSPRAFRSLEKMRLAIQEELTAMDRELAESHPGSPANIS